MRETGNPGSPPGAALAHAIIAAHVGNLSKRARDVLASMLRAEGLDDLEAAELVHEGREVWLGDERVAGSVLNELLRANLLRAEEAMGSKVERFTLNDEGRQVAGQYDGMVPELGDKVQSTDGMFSIGARVLHVYKNGKVKVETDFGETQTWKPGEFYVLTRGG